MSDPYATQSPTWWDKSLSPRYYWNPESSEMSSRAFPNYLPVYQDPAYTGSIDPAALGTADYLYSPQYTMGMTDISQDIPSDWKQVTTSEGGVPTTSLQYTGDTGGGGYDFSTIEDVISAITDMSGAWAAGLPSMMEGIDLDYSAQQELLPLLLEQLAEYERQPIDYTGMEDIISDLEGIDTTDIDRALATMERGPAQDEAMDFVAKSFGFNSADEYTNWLAEQRGLTRTDMPGITDEERAAYDKMMRMDIADQERRAQAQLEAVFADTGSSIQYMAEADEANQKIINSQTRYREALRLENTELQTQELDRRMERFNTMVQQGTMSATQYMDMRQRGYESILSGYLEKARTEVMTLTSALEGRMGIAGLRMEESAQDLAAINAQIDAVYNSIMVQTGINSSILQTINTQWDTLVAPVMDAYNALLSQEVLAQGDRALDLEEQAYEDEKTVTLWEGLLGLVEVAIAGIDLFV